MTVPQVAALAGQGGLPTRKGKRDGRHSVEGGTAKDGVQRSEDSGSQSRLGGCGGINPHMKRLHGKPSKGEYPGKKPELVKTTSS